MTQLDPPPAHPRRRPRVGPRDRRLRLRGSGRSSARSRPSAVLDRSPSIGVRGEARWATSTGSDSATSTSSAARRCLWGEASCRAPGRRPHGGRACDHDLALPRSWAGRDGYAGALPDLATSRRTSTPCACSSTASAAGWPRLASLHPCTGLSGADPARCRPVALDRGPARLRLRFGRASMAHRRPAGGHAGDRACPRLAHARAGPVLRDPARLLRDAAVDVADLVASRPRLACRPRDRLATSRLPEPPASDPSDESARRLRRAPPARRESGGPTIRTLAAAVRLAVAAALRRPAAAPAR